MLSPADDALLAAHDAARNGDRDLLASLAPRITGQRPIRQIRGVNRSATLIEIDPHRIEIVKIPSEPEARARAFERLRLGASRRVLVIRPFRSPG